MLNSGTHIARLELHWQRPLQQETEEGERSKLPTATCKLARPNRNRSTTNRNLAP
jgi:hypothetical protein